MPVPPVPMWIGTGPQICSNGTALLELPNITQAIVKATNGERSAFASALEGPCNVALKTGDDLATMFNNAYPYDLAFINNQLRSQSNFLEIEDMMHAYGNALIGLQVAFAGQLVNKDNTDSPIAIAMLDAPLNIQAAVGCAQATTLAAAVDTQQDCLQTWIQSFTAFLQADFQNTPLLQSFLKDILQPLLQKLIKFQYECDPTHPVGARATVSPDGVVVVTINLAGIVPCPGEGGDLAIKDAEILYYACGQVAPPTALNVPVLSDAAGNTQAPLFQLIVDKLANLQECCPPCQTPERLLFTGVQFIGDATLPSDGKNILFPTIWWEITKQVAQGEANFSNPPRWKYGTFTWVYQDATHSQPQFINYDGQRFFAPRDAVGIAWHLEPGIIASVHGYSRPPWTGGVTYP